MGITRDKEKHVWHGGIRTQDLRIESSVALPFVLRGRTILGVFIRR